jgi:hypothetical protein
LKFISLCGNGFLIKIKLTTAKNAILAKITYKYVYLNPARRIEAPIKLPAV